MNVPPSTIELPAASLTGSPVPELTSIHSARSRGPYQPLPHLLVAAAMREGLTLACTEIIRLQYGNTSSKRSYRSSFIPGLHDQCLIFERPR